MYTRLAAEHRCGPCFGERRGPPRDSPPHTERRPTITQIRAGTCVQHWAVTRESTLEGPTIQQFCASYLTHPASSETHSCRLRTFLGLLVIGLVVYASASRQQKTGQMRNGNTDVKDVYTHKANMSLSLTSAFYVAIVLKMGRQHAHVRAVGDSADQLGRLDSKHDERGRGTSRVQGVLAQGRCP